MVLKYLILFFSVTLINIQGYAQTTYAVSSAKSLYLTIKIIQITSHHITISEDFYLFINADYLPPFLPFILSTSGFGLMIISGFMYLGSKVGESELAKDFAATGQMTLTHYVSHVTLGMILFSILRDKSLSANVTMLQPSKPIFILLFSITYFVLSYWFSKLWIHYFKNGPLETILRKVSR